jgi:import inner membrane translocase subunit TIM17
MSERVDREPCPFRVVDDAGGAFVFGCVGGTVWHTIGGLRNAPKGQMVRQALSRVRARVPMLGGSFAVWGTLFSCCDCTFTYIRKKEDPWNAIMSGAATGGILAARAGTKAFAKSALVGGVVLAAIEGLNITLMRVIMPSLEKQQAAAGIEIDRLEPPRDPMRPRRRYQASTVKTIETYDQKELFATPAGNKGFDLDSMLLQGSSDSSENISSSTSKWDTPGFGSTPQEDEIPPEKPAWYKFW